MTDRASNTRDAHGRPRRHWLVKSEPDAFSWSDLWNAPERTTSWDGVRNHQARNFMRDEMRVGDLVLFYHSSTTLPAVMGIAEIVREAYPDRTALDPTSEYFDPKSSAEVPIWMMVDIRAVEPLPRPVTLDELRTVERLAGMMLLQRGSRLSVQPVRAEEFETIRRIARAGRGGA